MHSFPPDMPERAVRRLQCCCCGDETQGRQWHNRDTGYGLCHRCAVWIEQCGTEDMHRCYGIRGWHYDLDFKPDHLPDATEKV